MNECERVQEAIGRWLDGEVTHAESESMRLHWERCPECREERRRMENLQRALKSVLSVGSAPIEFAPFWRAVEARIQQKRRWHDDWAERLRGFLAPPRLAWAVPVAIALLLLVFYADRLRFGGARGSFASVESIDAYGHNVALWRENESKTTVIWLYQDQEGENETADDSAPSAPAF
ncbi:MAG TPA: zf-HC2 domain-containing protein [Candidatus Binatia bacterium]|nr:zf-HC2 domain-containing protein [Candidatus Binatia bacterium]